MQIHATTVCNEAGALMITGASGSGKSTLALGLLRRGWRLVADDVSVVSLAADGTLRVSAVPQGVGLLEVRGLGLLADVPNQQGVPLSACVALVAELPPRLPLKADYVELSGILVRQFSFWEKDTALVDKVLTAWDIVQNRCNLKAVN